MAVQGNQQVLHVQPTLEQIAALEQHSEQRHQHEQGLRQHREETGEHASRVLVHVFHVAARSSNPNGA